MTWIIKESSHGGVLALMGQNYEGGELAPCGIGYTMPAFIISEEHRFDTIREAEAYIRRRNA